MDVSEPLYMRVKNEIKADILNHKYQVGERIPSEAELIRIYGVSRITVRRAIQELADEDLLTKIHGSGTFVSAPKHNRHVVGIHSFTTDCLDSGIVPRTRILALNIVKATEADAKVIKVAPGEKIVYLERLRYADDEPVIIERDYFPFRFSSMLWETSASLQSITHLLEDKFNLKVGSFDATIEISIPFKQDAKLLELRSNTPVLLVRGCTYDTDGIPLYRSVQVLSGQKFKINIAKNVSWEG